MEHNGQPTVVVVEDDESINELLRTLLVDEGFRVVPAWNGQEALALARQVHPDLITLDLALPAVDGHTVLHKLKENPETQDIPVIVVSAYTYTLCPDDRKLVVSIIQKPFDLGDFLNAVSHAVRPAG
ncbi:MAG: response regulator [Chloroflexi bacterium]|nr:response regulator [Chloroflexota bacterium]